VNISGYAQVDVKGEIVGRDKIGGANEAELDQLFSRLREAIAQAEPEERDRLSGASDELRAELAQPQPDLGKIDRIQGLLVARGGQIGELTAAIFAYAPVQDALKSAFQRLLGSR